MESVAVGSEINGGVVSGPWLVPGLIRRQGRLVVTGASGTGKTWLMYQLALSGVTGRDPWDDKPLEPFEVLIVNLECRAYTMKRRLGLLAKKAGLTVEAKQAQEQLHTASRLADLDLLDPADRGWLLDEIDRVLPDLVILNPLAIDREDQDRTAELLETLDEIRTEMECALVLETPAMRSIRGPTSVKPGRDPYLLRWPELGLGLRAAPGTDEYELVGWRETRGYVWPRRVQMVDWWWTPISAPLGRPGMSRPLELGVAG